MAALLAWLLVLPGRGAAQAPPAPVGVAPAPVAAPAPADGQVGADGVGALVPALPARAAADTAAALRKLFANKRQGLKGRIVTGAASILLYNYYLAYSTPDDTRQRLGVGFFSALLAYQSYVLVSSLARQHRYRPAHEQQLLAALGRGEPLPRWCRRRLTDKYLKPNLAPAAPDSQPR